MHLEAITPPFKMRSAGLDDIKEEQGIEAKNATQWVGEKAKQEKKKEREREKT